MPSVRLGDGRTVKAEGRDSVRVRVKDNKEDCRVCYLCRSYPVICSQLGASQTRETGCCSMMSPAASSQKTTQ